MGFTGGLPDSRQTLAREHRDTPAVADVNMFQILSVVVAGWIIVAADFGDGKGSCCDQYQ